MGDVAVLAVTGLNREAAIVAGPSVATLASGGDITTLAARIEAALTADIRGIISIGVAGALDPSLKVGDAVIATSICRLPWVGEGSGMREAPIADEALSAPTSASGAPPSPAILPHQGERKAPCDAAWSLWLAALLPCAHRGPIYASDQMIVDAAGKARLHKQAGALCVDMESHVAAAVAEKHGLPFVALRFISDGANRALPRAAQAGMKPDGGMDIAAVLKSLAADPRQLPALIRTGLEAETAFKALTAARRKLGGQLAFEA